MKVTITFEFCPVWAPNSYWAMATFNGELVQSCGENFEAAEQRLTERLRAMKAVTRVPLPKEVEI